MSVPKASGTSIAESHVSIWGMAAAAILGALIYSNSLQGQFVFDDMVAIAGNPWAQCDPDTSSHSVDPIYTHDFWGRGMREFGSHLSWRPLTTSSFRWNYCMFDKWMPGWHATNILLHSFCSAAIVAWSTLCGATSRVSIAAGLLFASHPVHTEVVTNVVGRSESLCSLLALLAVMVYGSHGPTLPGSPEQTSHLRLWGAVALSVAAILAKETGITAIGMMMVIDITCSCRRRAVAGKSCTPWSHAFKRWAILLIAGMAVAIYRLRFNDHKPASFAPEENPARMSSSKLTRGLTWNYLLPLNAQVLLWPSTLLCDWSHDTVPLITSLSDSRNVITGLFWVILVALSLYLVLGWWKQQELPCPALLGLGTLIGTFLPASNLMFEVGFVLAERVLYLPSAGFALVSAVALSSLATKFCSRVGLHSPRSSMSSSSKERDDGSGRVFWAMVLAICIIYSARTWTRNPDWSDGHALWQSSLQVNDRNPKFWMGLAHSLGEKFGTARMAESIDAGYHAVALRATYVEAYYNLGTNLYQASRYDEAEKMLRTAIGLLPEHAGAYYNLGTSLFNANKAEAAVDILERLLAFQPNHMEAYNNLGAALVKIGDFEEAQRVYGVLADHMPGSPEPWVNLGLALAQAGQTDSAEQSFRRGLAIEPFNAQALFNMGVMYATAGRTQEAINTLGQLLQVQPEHTTARSYIQMLERQ